MKTAKICNFSHILQFFLCFFERLLYIHTRGIPKIIEVYGKESIDISDDAILVTIPFNRVNKVGNKVGNKNLNISQIKVLADIRKYDF